MKEIKIIESYFYNEFQDFVTDFINQKKVGELYDIKFSVVPERRGKTQRYVAMVIYNRKNEDSTNYNELHQASEYTLELNENAIFEAAVKIKPPLGTMPYWLASRKRIKELIEAISRQLSGETIPNTKLIFDWANEICEHCKLINSVQKDSKIYGWEREFE